VRENTDDVMVNCSGRTMVVTLDARELQLILFEAMLGLKRPAGSVAEALVTIRRQEPMMTQSLHRMAEAVAEYVAGRMEAATPEQGQLQ